MEEGRREEPPDGQVSTWVRQREAAGSLESALWRNFWTFALCHLAWGLGWGASDSFTIVTVFLHRLGLSKTVIGLVPGLLALGFALPGLPMAYFTERLPFKRGAFIWPHFPTLIAWLSLSGLALLMHRPPRPTLVLLFLLSYAVYALSIGAVVPLWYALIAKLIPQRLRGRLFGLVYLLSAVGAAGGAGLAGILLRRLPFPQGYASCFFLTFLFLSLGTAVLFIIVEPEPSPVTASRPLGAYLRYLLKMLTESKDFPFYLAARSLGSLAGMVSPFLAIYGVERFNAPSGSGVAANFALILLLSHSVTSPLWGSAGERRGFKWVAIMGGSLGILSIAVALLSPSLLLYHLVFALSGASMASGLIAHSNLVLDLCPHEDKASFVGLVGTITSPFVAIAPIVGGKLIDTISYVPTFFISTALGALSLYLLWLVPEPRKREKPPSHLGLHL